ncbi:MAG: MoaD/ThiS family protein [Pseudomonadota bacterium]
MKIKVLPVGVVKAFTGPRIIDLPEGADGHSLLEAIGLPAKLRIMIFVNGGKQKNDQPLSEGDEVKLVSSLGGG